MKLIIRPFILLLGVLAVVAVTHAATDAIGILKRSYSAESRAILTGQIKTTVYGWRGGQTSAEVRISRSGRRSRMDYLSGPLSGTTVIDTGDAVIRLNSAAKTAYISKTPEASKHLDQLLANYRPLLVGSSKVAGRTCYEVRLEPKYKGNPSERLWIDKTSLIALKTERHNSDGRLAISTEYVKANFAGRPAATLFAVPKGWKSVHLAGGTTTESQVRKAVGFTPVKPGYVPKGYSYSGCSTCNTCATMQCAGFRYSNGLNTISIFERKGACNGNGACCGTGRGRGWRGGRGAGGGPGTGTCRLADNLQARMYRATAGDLTVILVGDIAENELQKMANSFK